jgi:MYXO-CTERM domain-containing protein
MRRWLIAPCALCALTTAAAAQVTNGLTDPDDPAVIALVNEQDQIVCTASVIAPHTALTAAHCVVSMPTKLRAFFGTAVADGGTFIAVTDAKAHPQFDPGGNDIALVTLEEMAPVTPLELAPPLDASFVDTSLRVVGFGLVSPSLGGSGTKRFGTARVASVSAEDFIAVPEPSLSCLGDSGGPALVDNVIAGVVSRVDSQCVDHAVYTRIDIARDILIDPYLAATAEGAAGEGDTCFYADHCAAGLACNDEHICESEGGGCGCRSTSPGAGALIVLAFALALRRRRAQIAQA